jgi:hypothetical protein
MRARLRIASILIAVGLGSLTVILLHDPTVLVPHQPYGPWIFVRVLVLASLAALALILVMGVEDDLGIFDEAEIARDHATQWRAIALAFFVSALGTATCVAASAFVDYLDRALR